MTYDEYLRHSGILGMRWGVRNGPPYPLTRRSMSAAERKENPFSSGNSSEESKKTKPLPNKTIKVETETGERTNTKESSYRKMSDKELKDANNRLKAEQDYLDKSQKDITNGKKFVGALLITTGAMAVTKFVTTYVDTVVTSGAKKAGNETNKIVGPKIEELFKKYNEWRASRRSN